MQLLVETMDQNNFPISFRQGNESRNQRFNITSPQGLTATVGTSSSDALRSVFAHQSDAQGPASLTMLQPQVAAAPSSSELLLKAALLDLRNKEAALLRAFAMPRVMDREQSGFTQETHLRTASGNFLGNDNVSGNRNLLSSQAQRQSQLNDVLLNNMRFPVALSSECDMVNQAQTRSLLEEFVARNDNGHFNPTNRSVESSLGQLNQASTLGTSYLLGSLPSVGVASSFAFDKTLKLVREANELSMSSEGFPRTSDYQGSYKGSEDQMSALQLFDQSSCTSKFPAQPSPLAASRMSQQQEQMNALRGIDTFRVNFSTNSAKMPPTVSVDNPLEVDDSKTPATKSPTKKSSPRVSSRSQLPLPHDCTSADQVAYTLKVLGSTLRSRADPFINAAAFSDPGEPRFARGGVCELFPHKLYRMLEELEQEGKDKIISFLPHGRAFVVHKMDRFEREILPRYFSEQKKFGSFSRQLHLYGFQKVSWGPDSGAFYHELFLRGKPNLLNYMRRVGVPHGQDRRRFKLPGGPDPDFYTLAPMMSFAEARQVGSERAHNK